MALFRRQGDGALHRLQIAVQSPVPLWSKALQVNIGSVDEWEQFPPGCLLDGTIGDQNIDHAPLMNQGGTVLDVLITNQRLVVGVGHPDVTVAFQLQRLVGQRLRGHLRHFKLPVPGHGDFVVLAKGTA